MGTSRRNLTPLLEAGFETRYFEIAGGGHTSCEKHEHEHCVMVLRGTGEVFLDKEWHTLNFGDLVRVPSLIPHQFRNDGNEPFGILCIVDRDRDRPVLIEPEDIV